MAGRFDCATNLTGAGAFQLRRVARWASAPRRASPLPARRAAFRRTTRAFDPGGFISQRHSRQVTGTGLPSASTTLTVSNSAGVTLSSSVTATNLTLATAKSSRVRVSQCARRRQCDGGNSSNYVDGTMQKGFAPAADNRSPSLSAKARPIGRSILTA